MTNLEGQHGNANSKAGHPAGAWAKGLPALHLLL